MEIFHQQNNFDLIPAFLTFKKQKKNNNNIKLAKYI